MSAREVSFGTRVFYLTHHENTGRDLIFHFASAPDRSPIQKHLVLRTHQVISIADSWEERGSVSLVGRITREVDPATWSGKGRLDRLSLAPGEAIFDLVVESPGDRWITTSTITCTEACMTSHLGFAGIGPLTKWLASLWIVCLAVAIGLVWLFIKLTTHSH